MCWRGWRRVRRLDLVLTDLKMPEMSGWEVVQAVRSRWPTVRVGLMTGTPLRLQERREPVDVLLTKPMTLEQLHGALRAVKRGGEPSANQDQLRLHGMNSRSEVRRNRQPHRYAMVATLRRAGMSQAVDGAAST